MTQNDTVPSAEQLHQFIALFEVIGRLAPDQRAGTACAWCSTPVGHDGVDLGGRGDWLPHGCTTCYADRRTWLTTYYAWHTHADRCEYCQAAAPCHVAYGHQLLQAEAAARIGRPDLTCEQCGQRFQPPELMKPLIHDGNSGVVFSCIHAGPCPERGARA